LASVTTPLTADQQHQRAGLIAGLSAYILWGFLPVLFKLVDHVGSVTVVAERTFWSLLLVGGVLLAVGRIREVGAALRDSKTLRAMLMSSALLGSNWLLYVWAVETGQVLEASFGYFINPMLSVAIGMIFLGERQNRTQGIAIGIAVIALIIQAIGLGRIPYVALGLATTFAAYGFVRKQAAVSSTTGLVVEALLLAPFAIGYLLYEFATTGPGHHADPGTLFLLMLLGPATAAPLLLFTFAVQRLRLTTMGMMQYIAPSIAFVLAITAFGEHLNLVRIISFALIWFSLAVFTAGSMSKRPAPLA
jgi:chloramphenicol-sensitive protein RarD